MNILQLFNKEIMMIINNDNYSVKIIITSIIIILFTFYACKKDKNSYIGIKVYNGSSGNVYPPQLKPKSSIRSIVPFELEVDIVIVTDATDNSELILLLKQSANHYKNTYGGYVEYKIMDVLKLPNYNKDNYSLTEGTGYYCLPSSDIDNIEQSRIISILNKTSKIPIYAWYIDIETNKFIEIKPEKIKCGYE